MDVEPREDAAQMALTPEVVATYPLPGMAFPSDIAFSPDDAWLTYLWSADGSLTKQLYAVALANGVQQLLFSADRGGVTERNVSPEEALRRERQRQRAQGVTRYAWARNAERLIVPVPDGLYVLDGPKAPPRLLVAGGSGPILDPQLSPDGRQVAFVRESELYVVATEGGEPHQVTHGARGAGRTHGLAEFIAQEEMGRSHGFWWSDDSTRLAFAAVDDSQIPVYRVVHQGKDALGEGAQEDHRYPFAGGSNAQVRLGVLPATGGAPTWLDLDLWPHEYLARVDWSPDGTLYVQLENREQSELALLRFDAETGAGRVLLVERSDIWINLHDMFRPLRDGGFIWASERSGFRHLYRYDSDGAVRRPLTTGAWMVEEIVHLDERRRRAYFTGTLDRPLERHLYVASLDGGAV